MPSALSNEGQINLILDQIECVPSNFSDIAAHRANSRVMSALREVTAFDREDGKFYLDLARQMRALANEYPVPIDWRKTAKIREILAARKQAVRPTPFAVIFIGPALFKEVVSGRVETTASYQDCAAFKDPLVAMTAARILDQMGERNLRSITITNEVRDADSIFDKLSDFGFAQ